MLDNDMSAKCAAAPGDAQMLGLIVFLWFALNYAFAAQCFFAAARRFGATPATALNAAALWPRAMLAPVMSRI